MFHKSPNVHLRTPHRTASQHLHATYLIVKHANQILVILAVFSSPCFSLHDGGASYPPRCRCVSKAPFVAHMITTYIVCVLGCLVLASCSRRLDSCFSCFPPFGCVSFKISVDAIPWTHTLHHFLVCCDASGRTWLFFSAFPS